MTTGGWIIVAAAISMVAAALAASLAAWMQPPARGRLLLVAGLLSYPVIVGLWLWQAYRLFAKDNMALAVLFALSALWVAYYGLKAARERRLTFWFAA